MFRPVVAHSSLASVGAVSSRLSLTSAGLIAIVWLAAACGGTAPEVGEGADPALSEGRSVWVAQCASCHGAAGGGGRGPKLSDGQVLDRFPDVADQIDLVLNGRGAMPSYAGRLSDEQIESVVRYTREVLAVVE